MKEIINTELSNMDDLHIGMSNFEVRIAREHGIQFEVFHDKCGWTSAEVKKRIIAARNGDEWLRGEGPNAIREREERESRRFESIKSEYSEVRLELLKIIHNRTIDVYYEYLDNEYQEWYGTQKDKHDCAVSYFKNVMKEMNLPYNDTDESGIDIILPNGNKCVIHGLGIDVDGFVIHDTIDKLKGDIFIYINNMAQRKHIVSIMTRDIILTNYRNRGIDPQSMIPHEIMKANINNYDILKIKEQIC